MYAYVVQNPWTKFDPEGLSAVATWGDFAGAVSQSVDKVKTATVAVTTEISGVASAAMATAGAGAYQGATITRDARVAAIRVANQAWKDGQITTAQYLQIAEAAKTMPVANAGMAQGASEYAQKQAAAKVQEQIDLAVLTNQQAASPTGTSAKTEGGVAANQASAEGQSTSPSPESDPKPSEEPSAKKKASTSEVGDYVRTPTTNKGDFTKLKGDQGFRNNKTGEIWQKSNTNHSGTEGGEWKVGFNGKPPGSSKITVSPNGKIIKKD